MVVNFLYPHKCVLNILKKKYQESGRMHIWEFKMQELPGPLGGPWPLLAHFARPTPLRYISKISRKNFGSPRPNPGSATESLLNATNSKCDVMWWRESWLLAPTQPFFLWSNVHIRMFVMASSAIYHHYQISPSIPIYVVRSTTFFAHLRYTIILKYRSYNLALHDFIDLPGIPLKQLITSHEAINHSSRSLLSDFSSLEDNVNT